MLARTMSSTLSVYDLLVVEQALGTAVHRLWLMPRFPFFREPNCFEERRKAVVTAVVTAVTGTSCCHGAARIKRSWWPMCLWTQGRLGECRRKQLWACEKRCFRSFLLWACDCKWSLLKPHEAQSHAMPFGHFPVCEFEDGGEMWGTNSPWLEKILPAHNGPTRLEVVYCLLLECRNALQLCSGVAFIKSSKQLA